jgi:hypothetical protein
MQRMTDDALTLNAYLDEWLALQRTRIEPTTWANYRVMARYDLRPFLGERRLSELTVRDLDRHDHGHLRPRAAGHGPGRGGRLRAAARRARRGRVTTSPPSRFALSTAP